ncbi:flagellar basal body rod protein FlgB [Caballeronia sp. dw_19]|uniref:flagellar basal body rod protein FlgB n=1 Tax=Caballeronia sp. dw_19 TaxID=2719791 RepID=UPI001BCB5B2F|nr:flagellar basal body rod protein FlgB [Caballeronia sp. dw_19]
MGLNLEQALGVHPAALKLRAERTGILAANLANESTPRYQARDIDFRAALQRELDTPGDAAPPRFADSDSLYRIPSRPSQDGNTVELGIEQAAFSQNTVDFQTSLTFLNIKFKGLAAAINGNS